MYPDTPKKAREKCYFLAVFRQKKHLRPSPKNNSLLFDLAERRAKGLRSDAFCPDANRHAIAAAQGKGLLRGPVCTERSGAECRKMGWKTPCPE
ncbi:hypothetical protein AD951_00045 [Acetobacter malorum]|uniref:Uncharacterized protein n=1 Tax=Acetobacter malorum TaxID=178901 RepID=A0A149V5B8_9PROT|nr:hypothetical protein [Acetobacter malorum]KXV75421.1 hypothetical protein AD951_00045 [Acetobacter malorum]